MEFIKDDYSLLIKCDNESVAKKIDSCISELLKKSEYEDELGLYDIEDDIIQYWTVKEYFTIAAQDKEEIDFIEETIKKVLKRFGLGESKTEDGKPINESDGKGIDDHDIAQKVLDCMRDRHPEFIHGAGKFIDGEKIYLTFRLGNPMFEIPDEDVDRFSADNLESWASLVKDEDDWQVVIDLASLTTSEGIEEGPLTMAIIEEATKATEWLDEEIQVGTRSWGLPIN